ncbi:MAG TPA: hypothetical protein H9830_13320 [Candidatus Agrococcus pullicola]|uniref:Cell division protein FtsL n=1 Tax=Candidatus Agrococcus pullicola TaxID=2838429 RepID=A0A9D1YXS6_9MICO|nr:hypothetical protein [Candidatus Agrococcus pullicola]
MSTAVKKTATPLEHPQPRPSERRRFTALPRLAPRRKPKLVHGVVALTGLVTIVVAQLIMSVALSDGAYELSALQLEQAQAERTQQGLQEQIIALESPQHLAMSAEALGMENGDQRQFIELSTGSVTTGPDALHVENGSVISNGSRLAVPNELVMSENELSEIRQDQSMDDQRQREAEGYPGMLLPPEGVAGQE